MISIKSSLVSLAILTAFLSVAEWRRENRGPWSYKWLTSDNSTIIGGENDSIARAIRGGRGFSDPFRPYYEMTEDSRLPSTPTAWMPPVLPYFLAGLYWLTGDRRESVVAIIVTIQALAVWLTTCLVLHEAERLKRFWLGILIVTGGLAANFFELFQNTNDSWLLMLIVAVLWLCKTKVLFAKPQSVLVLAMWGLFGGFAALCGPVIGFVWAAVTTMFWSSKKQNDSFLKRFKPLLVSAVVSIAVVTPWTVRNRMVLGTWVPIKSNGLYEVWQSLCHDDDGLINMQSTAEHPWCSNGKERQRYYEVGEVQFIDEKWPAVRDVISDRPMEVIDRVCYRLLAACVYFQPLASSHEKMVWPMRFKRIVYLFPLISITVILALRTSPLEPQLKLAMAIYFFLLVPYVLVSYTDRYVAPIVWIKMILVLYGVDSVLAWCRQPMFDIDQPKT